MHDQETNNRNSQILEAVSGVSCVTDAGIPVAVPGARLMIIVTSISCKPAAVSVSGRGCHRYDGTHTYQLPQHLPYIINVQHVFHDILLSLTCGRDDDRPAR